MMESMAHVRRNVNRELAGGGGGDEKGQVMFTRVLHGARSADIFFDVFFDKGEKKLTYHLLQNNHPWAFDFQLCFTRTERYFTYYTGWAFTSRTWFMMTFITHV